MEVSQETHRSRSLATGLTALHAAVIKNDRKQVRVLLASKEHAVNERTPRGATPIMLACLYGRFDMFIYLLRQSASLESRDDEGFGCCDYVKQRLGFTQSLLEKYQDVADERPHVSGRKAIYELLRPFSSLIKQGRSNEPETLSVPSRASERRVISLRKGGVFEIVEVQRLALAEWGFELGRKTCAAVRGRDETTYRAIAISGWRGDEAERVSVAGECLNNATYLKLTREFAKVVGYVIRPNWLDTVFPGSPSEKAGAFGGCHAEKQLAIFVLRESMVLISGVRDFTLDNMARLKLAVTTDGLLPTDFVIELEHKPCHCCIGVCNRHYTNDVRANLRYKILTANQTQFLKLLHEKSGLKFEWVQREWFCEGKRPKLKHKDGLPASPKDLDTFEDEVDAVNNVNGDVVHGLGPSTPTTDNTDDDCVVVRGPRSRAREEREYGVPTKAGSEVGKEDWPIPAQKNVPKRLSLVASQKQRQKQTLIQRDLPSPPTSADKRTAGRQLPSTPDEASSGQSPERHMSVALEPFPQWSNFMMEWSSSPGSEEME